MYHCELSGFLDIDGEDKWQENTNSPFATQPNTQWSIRLAFLVYAVNDSAKFFQRKKQLLGDELYATVCSPAFKHSHLATDTPQKQRIVMNEFSEDKAKQKIKEILSNIHADSLEELTKLLALHFIVQD